MSVKTLTQRRKAIQALQAELARVPHEHLTLIIATFASGSPYEGRDDAGELREGLAAIKKDSRAWLARWLAETQPSETEAEALSELQKSANVPVFRPDEDEVQP